MINKQTEECQKAFPHLLLQLGQEVYDLNHTNNLSLTQVDYDLTISLTLIYVSRFMFSRGNTAAGATEVTGEETPTTRMALIFLCFDPVCIGSRTGCQGRLFLACVVLGVFLQRRVY